MNAKDKRGTRSDLAGKSLGFDPDELVQLRTLQCKEQSQGCQLGKFIQFF